MKKAVIFLIFIFAIIYTESSYAIKTSAISGADSMIVISRFQSGILFTSKQNSMQPSGSVSKMDLCGQNNLLFEKDEIEKKQAYFTLMFSTHIQYNPLKKKPTGSFRFRSLGIC